MSRPVTLTRWFFLSLILLAVSFSWFGCSKEPQNVTAPVIAPQEQLALSKAATEVQRVMAVQNRHTDRLLSIAGVVGTATTQLADGKYAVKILTKAPGLEKQLPASLDETPVIVEVVGEIRALAYTGKFDPVPTGVSMGNRNECSAGTDGAVVQNSSGTKFFLSNNHVFARENKAAIGEDILQPGRYDSQPQCDPNFPNHVADLSKFIKIQFGFSGKNKVDAAIAQIRSGVNFTCATNCGYTPRSTPATATLNMSVKKCGRTTELTTGTVTGLNVTVLVQYSGGKIARFVDQIQFTNMSSAGDSGSLIVVNGGPDDLKPVALLFAGSSTTTIGNKIQNVLGALGVTICGD